MTSAVHAFLKALPFNKDLNYISVFEAENFGKDLTVMAHVHRECIVLV